MKDTIKKLIAKRWFIFAFLLAHFLINVLIYLNTRAFKEISESTSIFQKLDMILAGERPALASGGGYFFTPAYIAWFFIRVFGSLHAYFIFQCLVTTLSTWVVYRIVLTVSGSRQAGIIAILLLSIYTEFLLLSAVFYNQSYDILFCALVLWLTLLLFREKNLWRAWLYILPLAFVVVVSLLFRSTLFKIHYYLFLASIICLVMKNFRGFANLLAASAVLYFILVIVQPTNFVKEGKVPHQSTFFWGHTPYGGKGGESNFIYQKNKDLYDMRLRVWVAQNKIDTIDRDVIVRFQEHEVTRFITEEPHKWIFLQVKKFFYTFGSVPQRDGLKMLMTGHVRLHWVLAAALLQIPFVLIILLFILLMDYRFRTFFTLSNYKFLIYLLGLYLITGVCFYIGFQERYRPVVLVIFFIPVIAINAKNLKTLFLPEKRKELIIRLLFICLMLGIWAFEAYDALVVDADRYFRVVQ